MICSALAFILLILLSMGRPRVVYSERDPYHIVARSNNKDWFDVPMDYLFGVYINVLKHCIQEHNVQLHAFVLMSNHFHMMLSTPNKNIDKFLRYFMTETSKGIGKKSSRINHIYGGRNHKNIILTAESYAFCLKYLYRNPVKANICERVENYPWSTISKKPNKMTALIQSPSYGHDAELPPGLADRINWFNYQSPNELDRAIEMAMKRNTLEVKLNSKTRKKINLTQYLYKKVPGT